MVTSRAALLALGLALGLTARASAQAQAPLTLPPPDERPRVSGVVFDVRGLMAALPTGDGWVPAVPEGPTLPGRGFGGEVGGHVYVASLGPIRIGVGASAGMAGRSASPDSPKEGTTPTPLQAAGLTVATRVRYVAPQLSLNFGHSSGWSYVSGGYGLSQSRSEATATDGRPAQVVETDWGRAINVGFGARWMTRRHLGLSVDLRWHRVPGGAATGAASARAGATLLNMAVGVALR